MNGTLLCHWYLELRNMNFFYKITFLRLLPWSLWKELLINVSSSHQLCYVKTLFWCFPRVAPYCSNWMFQQAIVKTAENIFGLCELPRIFSLRIFSSRGDCSTKNHTQDTVFWECHYINYIFKLLLIQSTEIHNP